MFIESAHWYAEQVFLNCFNHRLGERQMGFFFRPYFMEASDGLLGRIQHQFFWQSDGIH